MTKNGCFSALVAACPSLPVAVRVLGSHPDPLGWLSSIEDHGLLGSGDQDQTPCMVGWGEEGKSGWLGLVAYCSASRAHDGVDLSEEQV